MCGIVGSFEQSMFEVLMEANESRGNFGMGLIQLNKGRGSGTTKRKGKIDFNEIKYNSDLKYLVGHTQAPTSAKRVWEYDTSHPFHCGDWSIVHNGVLTNDDELRKSLQDNNTNPIDTSTIVALLEQNSSEYSKLGPTQRVEVISRTLEMLEGTFALAIVYLPKNTVYIVRQGSVLHYDSKGNFSTLKGNDSDYKAVDEGAIMQLKNKKWVEVGRFESNSPFAML